MSKDDRAPGRGSLGGRFWRVWTASAVSGLGDGMRLAALPLLAAALTRRPLAVAAVTAFEGLPWAVFALIAGALVDRWDRRRVMGWSDMVRFVATALLALAVLTHHASIPLLCLVALILGTAQTLFDNASQAILPAVVASSQFERANSRLASAQILTETFAGPPLGAALFVGIAALPFAFDSASFLVASLLVLALPGSYRVPRDGPPTRLHHEIREGLSWLWHHRLIRTLALMLAVWNMVTTAQAAVFVLYALHTLRLGKVAYSLLLTSAAVGGLLGSFIATRVIGRLGPGRTLQVVVAVGAATYAAIALTRQPLVVAALLAVEGLIGVVWNVTTVSARQSIIPPALFGRVNSVYRFLSWGSMPIGGALGGALATWFGLRAPFVVAAGALVVMLALGGRIISQRTFDAAYAEVAERDGAGAAAAGAQPEATTAP
jgi:MFS family permease